ncbi:hypothetical protein [Streptomyces sp. ME18-1-4]|uniref:hypothetical protein n=1 Tax=Streptomyces sp. ME18-1-4 TaxID=3028685 RepID=UPI0029B41B4A|nr:hypothetical protein [Streptomyces sp. ME18-1-4]MDX3241141.1 hypothetical protein [Streptomyces sp. ME18-1-4]
MQGHTEEGSAAAEQQPRPPFPSTTLHLVTQVHIDTPLDGAHTAPRAEDSHLAAVLATAWQPGR